MNKVTIFLLLTFFFYTLFSLSQGFVNNPVLGTQEVAVVPFDYLQDGNEQSLTDIDNGFFTSSFSIKSFIEEISYGKASLNGIVYPYRTNQPPLFGTGYTNCYPLDQDIVNQPDVDYSIIDGIVLLVHSNTTGCGAGVSSFEKLPFTTIDGDFNFRRSGFRTSFYFPHDFSKITSSTVAHEIIHSFGVPYHSNAYIKSNGQWTLQGYGNLFDIMGLRSQASHPCSLVKQQKGWLTDNEIENVSTTGTYRIHALEKTLPGQTQSIVIDLPNDLDIQPNDPTIFSKLYLEYRGLTGFDSRTNRNVPLSDGTMHTIQDPHGLLIIGADCQTNNDYCVPVLVDTHPEPMGNIGTNYEPHEASDAQLNLDETYFVGNNSISIEVVNVVEGDYIDVFIDFSTLSTNENSELGQLNIYPNPASDKVTIANPLNTSLEEISIYDLSGKKIKTITREAFDSSLSQISVDVSDMTNGTYLIQINSKEHSTTKKLVISQ
ncbi:T9SS type A sorting domain-containing protein [Flavobacteriaceae bacterium 14752]|uniref:T9SS type A sorting domain-containing protein n=1 Tax=Mesohalobacter salilacus TaxID=2491711 RepID=UPI000F6309FE|nr:T9SS C-terminal target domain-containing protein [Flavobacteriaceae bacterium 14752]